MNHKYMGRISSSISPLLTQLELPQTPETTNNLFISQLTDLWTTILVSSPHGQNLRNRCRRFPSLLTCSIISFERWPEQAYMHVATHFIKQFIPPDFEDEEET